MVWNIHKPESVLENEEHKTLWNFEIQTDNLISARKPDQVLTNKKTGQADYINKIK